MATWYVDSNASGDDSGSSWTNAAESLDAVDGSLADGDVVLVEYRHSRAYAAGAAKTLTFYPNGIGEVRIISVDKDDSNRFRPGAMESNNHNFTIATQSVACRLLIEGIHFKIDSSGAYYLALNGLFAIFSKCTFTTNSGSDVYYGAIQIKAPTIWDRCTVIDTMSSVRTSYGLIWLDADLQSFGTVFTVSYGSQRLFYTATAATGPSLISCSDLSNFAYLATNPYHPSVLTFERCKLKSGYALYVNPTYRNVGGIILNYCSSSELTATQLPLEKQATLAGYYSSSNATSAVYRNSGASDGENSWSYAMVNNSLMSIVVRVELAHTINTWHDATAAKDLTVHMGSGASALTTEDVWITVSWPDEASTTYSDGELLSTRSDYGWGSGVKATKTFTTTHGTDTVNSAGHGYGNGLMLRLTTTGTLPAGYSLGKTYYVVNAATDTLQLAETLGGSAVQISDDGSGTHTMNPLFQAGPGSSWTGTGPSTEYKFVITDIDPEEPGPVCVRVFFSKASATLWVCPNLVLS